MEDASKAIELAVGVIIFIIALTIAIVLYNKLADTADKALKINETQNSVVYNKNDIPSDFGYIYSSEDIYYLIEEVNKDSELYEKIEKIYIYKGHTNGNSLNEDIVNESSKKEITKPNDVYGINNIDSKYKIKYRYEYEEKDILTELNTHKPVEIIIIQYVEEL